VRWRKRHNPQQPCGLYRLFGKGNLQAGHNDSFSSYFGGDPVDSSYARGGDGREMTRAASGE